MLGLESGAEGSIAMEAQERRPIAEFFEIEGMQPDVIVGDDHGSTAMAAIDPDYGGWVDITDAANPIELEFTPTWFKVIGEPR